MNLACECEYVYLHQAREWRKEAIMQACQRVVIHTKMLKIRHVVKSVSVDFREHIIVEMEFPV